MATAEAAERETRTPAGAVIADAGVGPREAPLADMPPDPAPLPDVPAPDFLAPEQPVTENRVEEASPGRAPLTPAPASRRRAYGRAAGARGPSARVWAGLWIASFLLLAVLVGAAWHWRAPIARNWPPSLRLYAQLDPSMRP